MLVLNYIEILINFDSLELNIFELGINMKKNKFYLFLGAAPVLSVPLVACFMWW
nr:variable surface lipoprotein [Mycoplasmopsis bovis]